MSHIVTPTQGDSHSDVHTQPHNHTGSSHSDCAPKGKALPPPITIINIITVITIIVFIVVLITVIIIIIIIIIMCPNQSFRDI